MFDVGFSELALVFGVSLLVLGPKRLSGLVTKVGRWVGKARTMARDFRTQLENEVNLDELNKMTEMNSRSTVPPPPPEYTGEPQPETPTYPYSATEPPQTDDTYSHAHAAGEPPMPDTPAEPLQDPAAEAVAEAGTEAPHQGDLDLSTPDEPDLPPDDSHLPPDDARRYS